MAALDLTENATIMSISDSTAMNLSAGATIKSISNATPTPLDIGKPQIP